jgi:hypothetical protein
VTLRHQILRDAGVLPLACAIALGTAGVAGAGTKHPDPMNGLVHPNPMNGLAKAKRTHLGISHNFLHTMPHNFPKPHDAT